MRIYIPASIRSDYEGYSALIHLFQKAKEQAFSNIEFDFNNNKWFEANLAAIFGAIIYQTEKSTSTFSLVNSVSFAPASFVAETR